MSTLTLEQEVWIRAWCGAASSGVPGVIQYADKWADSALFKFRLQFPDSDTSAQASVLAEMGKRFSDGLKLSAPNVRDGLSRLAANPDPITQPPKETP